MRIKSGVCATIVSLLLLTTATAHTAPSRIVTAAKAFLATLDQKQRQTVSFAFDDAAQRVRWSNLPASFARRNGLNMGELSPAQRSAAMALVSSALSRRGSPRYDRSRVKDRQALTRIAVISGGIVVATALHYLTSPSLMLWHELFQRLYYLPIIYAAIFFGWRGGLVASILSALCYIPHIFLAWRHFNPDYAMNQYAEIIVFLLVGTVTGVLADRGMKQRKELEVASAQLAKVNRELQDSFEQIKRADRLSAIGQLSASLAHEIRNPLASIDGAANLIESTQTSDEMRKGSLAIIHKEIQRLNRLLTNLLDFARPRKPEFQLVEPGRLIDAIINLTGHSAQQNGITLRKEVPPSVPTFECDSEQMKQVLLNLAINAVQAMTGPGEVVLSARKKGLSVMIAVRDQGPGIEDEDIEKIFNPFFTTKEAGTGLGLSVVYQIVTQHGGIVKAEKNPDAGMTFSVVVPLRQRRSS